MHFELREFLSVFTLATLTGCARYQPSPLDVNRELADLKSVDLQQIVLDHVRPGQGEQRVPAEINFADGLSEPEIVALGLTLNPDLRAKRVALGESRAALITAGAWPNPVVGLSVQPGIDGTSGTLIDADAMFQLLRIGERDARKQAAAANADQVKAELIAAEFKFVGEVRQQYLAVFSAHQKVALLKQTLALRQRMLDTTQQQQRLGEASSLTVSAIELEAAQGARDLRQAETELMKERLTLNRQLGLPPSYDLNLSGLDEPLHVQVFDDVSDEDLDQRIITGRYELRSAEAEYTKAEQELRLAVLEQYPSLTLGPAFERDIGGSKSLGLGLSLELPLLNQNQGPIAEKKAARDLLRAQYTALLHQLRSDAFEARALLQAAKAEVDQQEREVLPQLQRSQELYENAYRAREINIIDLITAQQRAVDARQEYLNSLLQYRRAVIQLETTIGQELSHKAPAPPATQTN